MASHPLSGFSIDVVLGGVLVGGNSTRFGSDKASVRFGAGTLLEHQIHTLTMLGCAEVAYVGGELRSLQNLSEKGADATHIADHAPGEGPLAGLLALLDHAAGSTTLPPFACVFMVACDVPLLSVGTARRVLDGLRSAGSEVAVATGSREHWSCVAVRVSLRNSLHEVFARGTRALHEALSSTRIVRVTVDEDEMLNVNVPSELTFAKEAIANRSARRR